jgi:hypothetical protein
MAKALDAPRATARQAAPAKIIFRVMAQSSLIPMTLWRRERRRDVGKVTPCSKDFCRRIKTPGQTGDQGAKD